jgi:hypothetical protein
MKGHMFNRGENVMTKANPIVNVVVKYLKRSTTMHIVETTTNNII